MRLPVPPLRHSSISHILQLNYLEICNNLLLQNGTNRARTYDPLLVRQMLSQLSYDPIQTTQKRLELSTSAVTGRRSNQLSHWAIFCCTYVPSKLHTRNISFILPITLLGHALDRLVSVSSIHYCTSTSDLSTSSSSRGLTTYVGISHLEGGFTLRCLQRLSRPGLATLPCIWYATDTPAASPSRSSRTKDSSSQISYAHAG